jgi:3-oxoacyl-[acyl-carrier protein] reductase
MAHRMLGRVAIVTGSAQGLGHAVARRLARDGLRIVLADVQQDKVLAAARRMKDEGADVVACAVDVSSEPSVEVMIESALKAYRRIDVLVNVAGGSGEVAFPGIEGLPDDVWQAVLERNLKGTYLCCEAAMPFLRQAEGGRIVNFSSRTHLGSAGPIGTTGARVAYAVAKAGLHGLTEQLARELAPARVTANVVVPAFIQTEPGARAHDRLQAMEPAARESLLRALPMGGIPATSADIAEVVAFLVSREADHITGEEILVE